MTTLYTAKKYAVPALEAHCVEFLKKNLRADNAFMLLTQVSSQPSACSPSSEGPLSSGADRPEWSSSGSLEFFLAGV